MLPNHGVAYAVFLLARSARVKPRYDLVQWIGAARASGSYLATATDLDAPARFLLDVGLIERGAEASLRCRRCWRFQSLAIEKP